VGSITVRGARGIEAATRATTASASDGGVCQSPRATRRRAAARDAVALLVAEPGRVALTA
jgi:hypothetical protein